MTAELVHVPARPATDVEDIFEARQAGEAAVRGRIVVTEGYAMPLTVQRFEGEGAVAQVYVNPGRNVHWGICTPIWGTPTDGNLDTRPWTPVVAVSRPDGDRLLERLRAGPLRVTVRTRLDEGWYRCKIPVAMIRGESDDFVLVHGHYDSWDVGIGDNAVGDATLLELARIFHRHRDELKRSLYVAWWPAHSTGRYAGSAWFADVFAMKLRKRCVAAVNIDSPGCWHATEYDDVMGMAEVDALCRRAIADATGKAAKRRRPIRAGDYSFNQLGITSFFMLLSNIAEEERKALGFYPVGGCGGHIAWHTEEDRLEIADRENLERDLRVYVTALARVLNAEILPFDWRETARELRDALQGYAQQAGSLLDLSPAEAELRGLEAELHWLYAAIEGGDGGLAAHAVNRTLMELGRILVPLGYAQGERFDHDPALPLPAVPKLAAAHKLAVYARSRPDRLPFLQAGLRREVNKVANALYFVLVSRFTRPVPQENLRVFFHDASRGSAD